MTSGQTQGAAFTGHSFVDVDDNPQCIRQDPEGPDAAMIVDGGTSVEVREGETKLSMAAEPESKVEPVADIPEVSTGPEAEAAAEVEVDIDVEVDGVDDIVDTTLATDVLKEVATEPTDIKVGDGEEGRSFMAYLQEALLPQAMQGGLGDSGMADVEGLEPPRGEADLDHRHTLLNGDVLGISGTNVDVEDGEGALGGAGGGGEDDDEDIDIVDIDEEEEARVKMAMGVGEGIPLGDEEVEEGLLEEGAFTANGEMLEGDAGLAQALAEAEAAAGVASGLMVEEANAKRLRQKRRLGAEGEEEMEMDPTAGGWSADGDAVRRTRQRTARPAPAKKKLRRPTEEEETEGMGLGTAMGGGGVEEEELEHLQEDTLVGEDGEPSAAAGKLRRGTSPHATARVSKLGRKTDEPLVKFSIKSFTVPELIVALPESSTVGQLKKAVMDAAMKLLGGGLRVRVLMHGKRMHEEASSLAQAGISRATLGPGKVSDSLAFMLEPSPLYALNPGDTDPLLVLSQAIPEPAPVQPLSAVPQNMRPRAKVKGRAEEDADFDEAEERRLGRGKGRGRVPQSPHTTRVAAAQALAAIRAQAEASRGGGRVESEGLLGGDGEGLDPSSGAIVLHPSVQEDDLDESHMQIVQHVQHRRSSSALMNLDGRRRIRRPFTVSEVAMLVEAVEKLGNGRCAAALTSAWWRDVKNKAFSHAKHRTYVDLKDKWKTLVHTAQIAPHQRRGEPVPPDLLERVTKAHSYWTAQLRAQQDERDG